MHNLVVFFQDYETFCVMCFMQFKYSKAITGINTSGLMREKPQFHHRLTLINSKNNAFANRIVLDEVLKSQDYIYRNVCHGQKEDFLHTFIII